MAPLTENLLLSMVGLEKIARHDALTPVHVASVIRLALDEISLMSSDTDLVERSTSLTMLRRIIERFHQCDHDTGAVLNAIAQLNVAQLHDVKAIVTALGFSSRDSYRTGVQPHTALRYSHSSTK